MSILSFHRESLLWRCHERLISNLTWIFLVNQISTYYCGVTVCVVQTLCLFLLQNTLQVILNMIHNSFRSVSASGKQRVHTGNGYCIILMAWNNSLIDCVRHCDHLFSYYRRIVRVCGALFILLYVECVDICRVQNVAWWYLLDELFIRGRHTNSLFIILFAAGFQLELTRKL